MRYELFVSLRYLFARRKEKFISAISLISIAGVALGVCALIVVIAVMSGFDNDLREKIVGTNSHILIERQNGIADYDAVVEKVQAIKQVVAASPFINGQVLLTHNDDISSVILRGIDPPNEARVTKIREYIIKGKLDIGQGEIIIGEELARRLGIFYQDSVNIVSPVTRKTYVYRVAGIFNSGMYEYDAGLVFCSLADAQQLYGLGALASGVGVKVGDVYKAPLVRNEIQRALGYPYWVMTWQDANRNLFSALKLEKTVMFIILALIVVVAAFNIASTLIMMVSEKTKDIGILKSIGATNSSIMSIFTIEGILIGVFGTLLGAAGGLGICQLLARYKFIDLPRDIYYIDKLPVLVQQQDIVAIIAAAFVIAFLATLYPAHQASRLDVVEALRYE